jgi:prepilin-type processing-associated H-X9-DG protein
VDFGLDGKVAWVLGASSGLGRSCAVVLGREGARVAASARREDELKNVATEIAAETGNESIAVPCDVTDAEAITSAAQRVRSELGPVDILVSNAGGPTPGTFEDLDEDALHGAFTLTTASAWRLAKSVVPDMRAGSGGCLIFLTSGSTKEVIPELLLSNTMRGGDVNAPTSASIPDGSLNLTGTLAYAQGINNWLYNATMVPRVGQVGSWGWPGSLHPTGCNFLFGDGSVRFVKDTVAPETWWAIGTRNGREVISADAF